MGNVSLPDKRRDEDEWYPEEKVTGRISFRNPEEHELPEHPCDDCKALEAWCGECPWASETQIFNQER